MMDNLQIWHKKTKNQNRMNWRLISAHLCLPQNFIVAAISCPAKTSQLIQSQSHIHSYSFLFDCFRPVADDGSYPYKSVTMFHWNTKKKINKLLFFELNRLR